MKKLENKENEDYKDRIKKLIERVEKGESSPEAYQQLLDKLEEVKEKVRSITKRQDRKEKAIVGFVFVVREYYELKADSNYPFNKKDLDKKIDAIYKLIVKELWKPIPSIPHKWDIPNKKKIAENIRMVLGEENYEYFYKKFKIKKIFHLRFEEKYPKATNWYFCLWTIAFIVLVIIWFIQRS